MLALNESFAPGWRAESATGLATSARPKVQGWMNGWATVSTTATASLVYGPDRVAKLALLLLPVSLLCAVVWLMSRRRVRASLGRRWLSLRTRLRRSRGRAGAREATT